MDIQTILSQIDLGSYALPEFQRGYVWNRDQVRKLMNSLYHGYPRVCRLNSLMVMKGIIPQGKPCTHLTTCFASSQISAASRGV